MKLDQSFQKFIKINSVITYIFSADHFLDCLLQMKLVKLNGLSIGNNCPSKIIKNNLMWIKIANQNHSHGNRRIEIYTLSQLASEPPTLFWLMLDCLNYLLLLVLDFINRCCILHLFSHWQPSPCMKITFNNSSCFVLRKFLPSVFTWVE